MVMLPGAPESCEPARLKLCDDEVVPESKVPKFNEEGEAERVCSWGTMVTRKLSKSALLATVVEYLYANPKYFRASEVPGVFIVLGTPTL